MATSRPTLSFRAICPKVHFCLSFMDTICASRAMFTRGRPRGGAERTVPARARIPASMTGGMYPGTTNHFCISWRVSVGRLEAGCRADFAFSFPCLLVLFMAP